MEPTNPTKAAKTNPSNLEELEARRLQLEKERGKPVYLVAAPTSKPKSIDEYVKWLPLFFRRPSRDELQSYLALQSAQRMFDATELMINSCVIEGDTQAILDDDDLFFAIHTGFRGMIEMRQGVLKKS
jgi:hypothetical protein